MASASSIIKKVTKVLNKVGPPVRLVYLRTTTRSGDDPLTGRPGTVITSDKLLNPQPFYERMGRQRIPGGHTKAEDAALGSGLVQVLDDWVMYISPDALTLAQIEDPNFLLVFKSAGANPNPEVLRLIDMDPAAIYGANVLFTCYMRSASRT